MTMKLIEHFVVGLLLACFAAGFSMHATADASKLRDRAKLDLNESIAEDDDDKMRQALITLVQMSDDGDSEASYILGMVFSTSKTPKIQRSVTLAERYLLRGARTCHQASLKAIGDYVYKKRGSKLFDPARAIRLQKLCETKVADKENENLSSKKRNQSPQKAPNRPTDAQEDKSYQPQITDQVRTAWLSQKPKNLNFYSGGSGVAINQKGVFLTNEHVINKCTRIAVLYNGMIASGRVLFENENLDLAAVAVNAPTPHFSVFDSSDLRLGERLVALGYPAFNLFGHEPSISEGRLTNTSDEGSDIRKDGFLLVSLPIASGNSGGPVYNSRGLLRGLVSYGFDSDMLSEALEKDGKGAFIDTMTFNFIVSGLRVVEHLSQTNITYTKTSAVKARQDVEDLAESGKLALAAIACG